MAPYLMEIPIVKKMMKQPQLTINVLAHPNQNENQFRQPTLQVIIVISFELIILRIFHVNLISM